MLPAATALSLGVRQKPQNPVTWPDLGCARRAVGEHPSYPFPCTAPRPTVDDSTYVPLEREG